MTDTSPRQQTNCSTNTQNRYSDRMLTDRPDRVRSCRTCEREAQPSKQTVCRRHCRETPENRTIIARYHGPASHTLVNACAHETYLWTPMCVSHVTLAFTRIFIPNGPLKLQKTPHKTPCRGTTLGRRAWSAYSSFNSLLFRSPSSPKRYVTQVHRPAHDRPGGNHVQQHCRATARSEYRWCQRKRSDPTDEMPLQRLHPLHVARLPRPRHNRRPGRDRGSGRGGRGGDHG